MVPVLVISFLLQIAAAYLALRLIRVTGRRRAWLVVATAILLMAVRRLTTFWTLLHGHVLDPAEVAAEWIALATSVLMVVGVGWIAPVFLSIRRSGDALRESEQKLAGIISSIQDPMYVVDEHHNIVWASDVAKRLFGADLVGRRCYSAIYGHNSACEECIVLRTFADGKVHEHEHETEVLGSAGRKRIFWCTSSVASRSESGAPRLVVNIARDITDRKRSEAALEESERRYRIMFDESPVALWEEDFSEVKERLKRLRQSGVHDLKAFFEENPEEVSALAARVRIVAVNKAALDLYEADRVEDFQGDLRNLFRDETFNTFREELLAVAEGKTRFSCDTAARTRKGKDRHTHLSWSVVPGHEETYGRILVSVLDITDRKRAEAELTQRARLEKAISDLRERLLHPALLREQLRWITDMVVSEFKADFCRVWMIRQGDLCEECMHRSVTKVDTIPEPDSEKFLKMVGNGLHDCIYRNRCLHLLASSGRYTHVDGKVHRRVPFGCYKIGRVAAEIDRHFLTNEVQTDVRVHDHDWARRLGLQSFAGYRLTSTEGKPLGVLALFSKNRISPYEDGLLGDLANTASHVIQVRRAEEERALLGTAVAQAAESIVISDPDGKIRYVNPAFERNTGYAREEALGETLRFLKSGEHGEAFFRAMWNTVKSGKTWSGRVVNRKKDGALYQEEVTMSPVRGSAGEIVCFVEVRRDITQEVAMEERLRQAQKMEAVGTLAGGIAHDFNNILGAILGYTSLMRIGLGPSHPHLTDLETIEKSAHRGAELAKRLLSFARKGKHVPRPLNLNSVVDEVLNLLRETVSRKIGIETRLDPALPNVLADEGQMHQVVMNLCLNACEAMPKGGSLVVKTERWRTSEAFFTEMPDSARRGYVVLTVRDTGAGMDAETKGRIFEPFFTTKTERSGTGLGLAMVYGIVRSHDGDVAVESASGEGSVFRVYLPETEASADARRPEASERLEGTETILVVDDEEAFRHLASKVFSGLGYTVLEASSGARAVQILTERKEEVALAVLDIEMPGMDGQETFWTLRAIRPDLKVLICTGSLFRNGSADLFSERGVDLIQKPFTVEEITVKVRQVLDAP